MNEKIRQFLVPLATAGVIFINYLAGTGRINNVTPEVVSDKYPTVITPAGYAFAIWSLIYLGMIAFSIYQALPSQTENPRFVGIRRTYLLNCAANCGWIILWHYEMVPASLLMMLILLVTLVAINVKLSSAESVAEIWMAKVPFSIYFGWVTVATILNAAILVVFLGFQAGDTASQAIGAALMLAATVIGVLMRSRLGLTAFPVTIAWALTAIAVAHGGKTIIVVSAAIGVIVLLVAALSAFLGAKNQTG